MRPALFLSMLPVIVSLGLAACAAADTEDAADTAGAMEMGAGSRSGLRPGAYTSADDNTWLVIEQEDLNQLRATLTITSRRDANGNADGAFGYVDVSLGSHVSINDKYCPVDLKVTGDTVHASSSGGGSCSRFSVDLVRRVPKDVEGEFSCHNGDLTKATLQIASAGQAGAHVSFSTEEGEKESFDAKFRIPATQLVHLTAGEETNFSAEDDHYREATTTRITFTSHDTIRWEQENHGWDCTRK
jgi:hypothetical protein